MSENKSYHCKATEKQAKDTQQKSSNSESETTYDAPVSLENLMNKFTESVKSDDQLGPHFSIQELHGQQTNVTQRLAVPGWLQRKA